MTWFGLHSHHVEGGEGGGSLAALISSNELKLHKYTCTYMYNVSTCIYLYLDQVTWFRHPVTMCVHHFSPTRVTLSYDKSLHVLCFTPLMTKAFCTSIEFIQYNHVIRDPLLLFCTAARNILCLKIQWQVHISARVKVRIQTDMTCEDDDDATTRTLH